jgi:hypothetical protein
LFALKLFYGERNHWRYSVSASFPADDGQSTYTQLESQFLLRKTKARAGLLQLGWCQVGLSAQGIRFNTNTIAMSNRFNTTNI